MRENWSYSPKLHSCVKLQRKYCIVFEFCTGASHLSETQMICLCCQFPKHLMMNSWFWRKKYMDVCFDKSFKCHCWFVFRMLWFFFCLFVYFHFLQAPLVTLIFVWFCFQGLYYLHNKGKMHRDIKVSLGENIWNINVMKTF